MRDWAWSCQARRQKGVAMRFKFKAKYLPMLDKLVDQLELLAAKIPKKIP